MQTPNDDILALIWSLIPPDHVIESDRQKAIRIVRRGEYDESVNCYKNALLETDGMLMRGEVVFNTPDNTLDNVILRVIESPTSDILTGIGGDKIMQTVLPVPETVRQAVDLVKNGGIENCSIRLADMEPHRFMELTDKLLIERLARKSNEVKELYLKSDKSWGQTFYAMLLRSMGAGKNQENFMELASRATYKMALRERYSIELLEALLLGTSGLLGGCYYDDYIHRLRKNFNYLQNKYRIEPMHPAEWIRKGYPAGNPIIRLVQTASLIANENIDIEAIINCKSCEDLYAMFDAEVSEYWTEHYVPDSRSEKSRKKIGKQKADIMGINMAAPLIFAYGDHYGKYEYKERAVDLLGAIDGEKNSVVNPWSAVGVPIKSAYDSQAIIQLTREYCEKKRCTSCKLGRQIIKERL